jgi:FAD/FMN-containing dehydrogenase
MNSALMAGLRRSLPPDQLISEPEDLYTYSYDGTPILKTLPEGVVFATTVEEVASVLRLATEYRTPIVTRGSGTGLSGGSIPVPGSVVLCLSRMNRILELDADNLTLLVEPGVINQDAGMCAESVGLFYPPDPGSMKVSTIGGNVSENSGGLRGLIRGHAGLRDGFGSGVTHRRGLFHAYAVELGGTISGEHGIGLTKKTFLPGAIGELNVRILRTLKSARSIRRGFSIPVKSSSTDPAEAASRHP